MTITYKPVAIIIDDFTSRSLEYANTTLYDAGYINNVTSYDYYTVDGLTVDGYGDSDWVETTFYGPLIYTELPSATDYSLAEIYHNSNTFVGIYGYYTYSYDYLEWVAHESTGNAHVQHGDWVVDAFKSQLDSNVETILIDTDTQYGGYINSVQSNIAFAYIDDIINDWLIKNNTEDINYLPMVLSASFGGSALTSPENYAIQTLIDNFAVVVQSVPNVTTNESGGLSWGDSYSDIINVAAYNVDTNGDSLHGSPTNSNVIDIYANGYVEHPGWDSGWSFGTSFATPRVAAELTNIFVDIFDYINNSLATGGLTQEDIESSSTVDYSDYINSLLELMTTDIYVEIDGIWYDETVPVLSDDVSTSALPVIVPDDFGNSSIYPITNSAYSLPQEEINTTPTVANAITSVNTNDNIQGTTGADSVATLGGSNIVSALAGNDVVNLASDSTWNSSYVAKNVSNADSVGTNQTVTLSGLNRFSDVIDGGADTDTLNLTTGNDAFFIDDVYSDTHSSLSASLTSTTQGIDSIARIANLEVINAGDGNDIVDLTSANFILANAIEINGGAGNDVLWGSNSDDTINGGEGNDTIFGGSGNDTLTGGTGNDIFQFTATAGSDTVIDFNLSGDAIKLYYRTEDGHTNASLSLDNGILTWNVDNTVSNVAIDLSATVSFNNTLDEFNIDFIEIV